MNKKVLSIVLSWILVAVVILIIVNFSLESGEKSTNTSEEVVDSIINSSTNITSEQRETISMLIRKVAHFGIYMLLGFCLFNAFSVTFSRKTIYAQLFSCICLLIFSLVDEFVLQNVALDRAPLFIDVIIDFSGGVVGTFLFLILLTILKKTNKNTEISN